MFSTTLAARVPHCWQVSLVIAELSLIAEQPHLNYSGTFGFASLAENINANKFFSVFLQVALFDSTAFVRKI